MQKKYQSPLAWGCYALIASAIAASVGCHSSDDAQRTRISDFCVDFADELSTFQASLRRAAPDPLNNVWDSTLHRITTTSMKVCIPEPVTCLRYTDEEVGNTPVFMHALDVLIQAFKQQHSCPKS